MGIRPQCPRSVMEQARYSRYSVSLSCWVVAQLAISDMTLAETSLAIHPFTNLISSIQNLEYRCLWFLLGQRYFKFREDLVKSQAVEKDMCSNSLLKIQKDGFYVPKDFVR